MIWFANLDPATLCLNLDFTTISNGNEEDQGIVDCLMSCLEGELEVFKKKLDNLPSLDGRIRCARLASVIWHEQRHFIDLILLNYGNYIFRQYLTCYINIPTFFRDFEKNKQNSILMPISLYNDPVSQIQYNLSPLSKLSKLLIDDLFAREKAISSERKQLNPNVKEIGGYAQLEGLGYIFQTAGIENIIPDYFQYLSDDLNHTDINGVKYNWFLNFRNSFKFDIKKHGENRLIAKIGALPIVFYASLSTRHWRDDQDDAKKDSNIKKRFLTPTDRLAILMEELKKNKPLLNSPNIHEIWNEINKILKRKFGRTIIEEIEVDLQMHKQSMLRKEEHLGLQPNLKQILEDHYQLRIKLLGLLKSNPEFLLHPDVYSKEVLPLVKPIPILNFPTGKDETLFNKSNWKGLHKAEITLKGKERKIICWNVGPKVWDKKNVLKFNFIENWLEIQTIVSPLAKALLKGRNHNSAPGPEFLSMEQELLEAGFTLIYDEEFKYPQQLIMSAKHFFNLKGIKESICDLCLQKINYPNGFLASPWVFRKNESIIQKTVDRLGGGKEGEIRFRTDWSPWLVCEECRVEIIDPELIIV